MFLYILAITILFYSSLLRYYKLIFSSFHITSFLQHTNLYFHFLISFCHILNNPYLKQHFPLSFPQTRKKRQQTNYFRNCITSKTIHSSWLMHSVRFLSFSPSQIEAFLPLFSSIFILLNCGSLSLSLSLLQPQRFRLSFLLCAPLLIFYSLILSFDIC